MHHRPTSKRINCNPIKNPRKLPLFLDRKRQMGSRFIILFLVSVVFAVAPPAKAELTPNCTHVETSLTSCLRYAVGEDPMPLPNCCPQVRKEDFVCLCDLVRVAFNGEPLGPYTLDYYRTVNLSTICNITGADIKLCGRNLNFLAFAIDLLFFSL